MKRIESGNPYKEVAEIIHEYREKHSEFWRSDFIVTLKIGDEISTELFIFEDDIYGEEYMWKYDWWEGEKDVFICGFMPIEGMVLNNIGEMMEMTEK